MMTTNGVGFCRDELVDTDSGATRFVCSWHSAAPPALYKYAQGTGQYAPAYTRVRVPAWSLLLHSRTQLTVHFTLFHMFITVAPRTSGAIAQLLVSPVLGVVLVEFANGYAYEYTNVSRRAIANLLLNPNMSLGFWVNQNCIAPKRTACLSLA